MKIDPCVAIRKVFSDQYFVVLTLLLSLCTALWGMRPAILG